MKIIKIKEDYYVVVDDSEIKEGDWYYLPRTHSVYQCKEDATELNLERDFGVSKITHSTQPLEKFTYDNLSHEVFSMDYHNIKPISLQEVKELIGEVDVQKKAVLYAHSIPIQMSQDELDYAFNSYYNGYNQAIEDNKEKKYTEEDLYRFGEKCFNHKHLSVETLMDIFKKNLQPKTEWEVELIDGKLKLV